MEGNLRYLVCSAFYCVLSKCNQDLFYRVIDYYVWVCVWMCEYVSNEDFELLTSVFKCVGVGVFGYLFGCGCVSNKDLLASVFGYVGVGVWMCW